MFGVGINNIEIKEACTCEDLRHGNRPRVRSVYSLGMTAAMMGWTQICQIKDYDEIAKEELEKEQD